MSRYTGLIQAFDKLAEASATVALELQALETPEAGAPLSAPVSAVRGSGEAPAAATDTSMCPKHHKPWTQGKFGEYCTSTSDDEAWAKVKPDGKMFCSITPRNAPDWLRVNSA